MREALLASAARVRRAFAAVLSTRTPRSFVARGRAWNPTAYPPTIRYRTRWALSDAMNSSKSGNVTLSLQEEPVEDALADEVDPLLR
jgi:hypothetical protein